MRTHHHLGGDVQVRDLVGLGDEGRGTGGPRVRFDHIYIPFLDGELDVDESLDVEGPGDLLCSIFHSGDHHRAEVEGGQHGVAVSAVDAGGLDVLHHTHHVEVLSVKDGVDLCFLTAIQEVVDQDLVIRQMLEQADHRAFQLFVVDDDAHALSAQYVGRTYKHGVTNLVGHINGFINRVGGAVIGVGDAEFLEHVAETTTVFGDVHAVEGGTDDANAFVVELFREFEGRLSTELNDDTFRLLVFDDLPEMFPEHRLEIELIGHIEVGRYGFGVTVYHDGLITAFLDGQQSVHAAIVEFDALPDAVGTAAEHDDLFLIGHLAFIDAAAFEGAVEIRRFGFEFRRTGVHHFIHPANAGCLAFFVHFVFRAMLHDLADLLITETHMLGFKQQFGRKGIEFVFGDLLFEVDDLLDLEDEPAVDICRLYDALDADAHHQGILNAEYAIPLGCLEVFQDLFRLHLVLAVIAQSHCIVLEALTSLLDGFSETATDGHHFPDGFHLQSEGVIGTFELIEIPARHLHDDVVECRFKVCRGCLGDLVLQFIEGKAEGQFRSDLGDRIPGGLGGECGGAAYAGIDLDGNDLFRFRIEGELHITATGEVAEVAHHADGRIAHELKCSVAQGHGRGHGH